MNRARATPGPMVWVALALALAPVTAALSGCGGTGGYRVRAIFDNAANVIPGEDVKVAGVRVGRVAALRVTPDKKAAVTLEIDDPGFQDFRADARCAIRLQSLIGEKFVDCTPTQPHAAGAALPPPLPTIPNGRPGAGERLLGVAQTSSPVEYDLIQDIARLPERQRLSIILNELGTGLAGRGDDLRAVIRRADPALQETDAVLGILAAQDRTLARLADDSARALAPLARQRRQFADSFVQIGKVAQATAQRRAALAQDLRRLPAFLRELSPTMDQLGRLATEGAPVLANLRAAAPGINGFATGLKPTVTAAGPFFDTLGKTAKDGTLTLVQARPAVSSLGAFAAQAKPALGQVAPLLQSLQDTGGIERFMDFLYNGTGAINGEDSVSHYLRGALIVNNCSGYALTSTPGCSANFISNATAAQAAAARPSAARGGSLLDYLLGP
jgi:phospholipid/cholesterol/gamma-HCH transport system substrate-binding protein